MPSGIHNDRLKASQERVSLAIEHVILNRVSFVDTLCDFIL